MTSVDSKISLFEEGLKNKIDDFKQHSERHKKTFRQQQLLIACDLANYLAILGELFGKVSAAAKQ